MMFSCLPTWPEQIEDRIRGGGAAAGAANCLPASSSDIAGGFIQLHHPRVGGRQQLRRPKLC